MSKDEDEYEYEYDPDAVVLPSGRVLRPNCRYIGINDDLETVGGYDDGLFRYDNPLTKEDRVFLSQRMIELWQKFAYAEDET